MLNKKMMSLLVASMVSLSVVGCESTVEEPKSNIVNTTNVNMQVVKKESVVDITSIELKQDSYNRNYLEVTYTFTNNDIMATSASTVVNMSAWQDTICFYPQVTKYTEYEKEMIEVGQSRTECRFYVMVDTDKEVLLKVQENFSTDTSITTFVINLDDMSIQRVAN